MLQYKTTVIPAIKYEGVSVKEFEFGITVETGNKAVAPIGAAIEAEAKGGWTLHSITLLPQRFTRKKKISEILFGWIPILGRLIFPNMYTETKLGHEANVYVLVFVKEA